MNKTHRLIALLGVVLICAGIVCMLLGAFLPTLRAVLMNVSLTATIAALGILVCLGAIRKRSEQKPDDPSAD